METREEEPGTGETDAGDDGGSFRVLLRALVAIGLTVFGVILSTLGSLPGLFLGLDSILVVGVTLFTSELGYVVAGITFVLITGRGLEYLDLSLPGGRREWGIVAGVIVGAFVFRTVVLAGSLSVGVEPSPSSITQFDVPMQTLLLLFIPFSILVVGPAEELLFRGVVQKYLREVVSGTAAIVGAGLLFGVIHVFALVQSTGLGTVVSVVTITLVGFSFGWLYERTGSLPAAMLGHGAYNALIGASALALQNLG